MVKGLFNKVGLATKLNSKTIATSSQSNQEKDKWVNETVFKAWLERYK